jgi:hypothetical protein
VSCPSYSNQPQACCHTVSNGAGRLVVLNKKMLAARVLRAPLCRALAKRFARVG